MSTDRSYFDSPAYFSGQQPFLRCVALLLLFTGFVSPSVSLVGWVVVALVAAWAVLRAEWAPDTPAKLPAGAGHSAPALWDGCMKRSLRSPVITLVIGGLALLVATPASASHFPAVLSNAAMKLRSNGVIPVFLPREIPAIISRYGIERVVVEQSDSGYKVSLYFPGQASDATYAGSISGFTGTLSPSSLPGTTSVRLANGASALFRPVSCGGSCAPANLRWQVGRFEYQLQLRLHSDLSRLRQRQTLVEMADSMELLH